MAHRPKRVSIQPPVTVAARGIGPEASGREIVHVTKAVGIDEFRSECPSKDTPATSSPVGRIIYPAPETPASGASRRTVVLLAAVAIVEALALAAVAVYASGVLSTATGTLLIDSAPAGAQVSIDGREAGTTPTRLAVSVGQHAVEVRIGGHTSSLAVSVDRGQTTRAQVAVVGAAMAEPGSATLTSESSAAPITRNGTPTEVTPLSIDARAGGPSAIAATRSRPGVTRTVRVEDEP